MAFFGLVVEKKVVFFYKNKWYDLPIIQGKESTGANAIATFKKKAIVVGGDFANDTNTTRNCVLIQLKKSPQFSFPKQPPLGYKSSVVYLSKKILIACGTSGVDISTNGGVNWQNISKESFHVVKKSKTSNDVFLAGGRGKIAHLIFE